MSKIALRNPGVIALRREHAAGMRKPMIGAPMAGDPRLEDTNQGMADLRDDGERLLCRRVCQYAAIMSIKAGILPGDVSGLKAQFLPPATVVFWSYDLKIEIARYVVPDRIMTFGEAGDHYERTGPW